MSEKKTMPPSSQQNLDIDKSVQSAANISTLVMPSTNRGHNRRPRFITDPYFHVRERNELQHKYGQDVC